MSSKLLHAIFLLLLFCSTQAASFGNTTEYFAAMARGEELDDVDLEDIVSLDPFLPASVKSWSSRDESSQIFTADLRTLIRFILEEIDVKQVESVQQIAAYSRRAPSDRLWLLMRRILI